MTVFSVKVNGLYFFIQKWRLDEVFTFDKGHICQSDSKQLAKFCLVRSAQRRWFKERLDFEVLFKHHHFWETSGCIEWKDLSTIQVSAQVFV